MSDPPEFTREMSAAEACERLIGAGWMEIGRGDWSWVYGHADSPWAVRVTPFDPAYALFAQACLDGPGNRWLPKVKMVVPLRRDGYATFIERLWAAPEPFAAAFCAALGLPNHSGYEIQQDTGPFDPADPDLMALREKILALMRQGQARYALWGGSDIRAGQVLVDAQGQLKLVDPVFLRGPAMVEAIDGGSPDRLSDFSRAQLEDFLTIPAFTPGPETEALRKKVAQMFSAR
ncbi:hypothetical protein [Phenylobacterium sp.]|uniref:hypothetical protein n=1 Tax=Phenylobacterium sp. TaxID=1871053 RepID=UPI003001CA26